MATDDLQLKKTPPVIQPETCPGCGRELPPSAVLCTGCGYDLRSGQAIHSSTPPPELEQERSVQIIDSEGWLCLGVGLGVAAAFHVIPFLTFFGSYLDILIHECGHALVAWSLGFPSIPAFNFEYGGGVAMHFGGSPHWWLIALVYLFLGWMLWLNRFSKVGLSIFVGATVFYALVAHTGLNEIAITMMGHGFVLIVASIFLYRAFSGAILHSSERPAYSFCGGFLVINQARFALSLLFSQDARQEYFNRPDGLTNDFVKIAESLHLPFLLCIGVFLIICLLPPFVGWAAHRYRAWW